MASDKHKCHVDGQKLRKARELHGWSQEDLSEQTGLRANTEHGERAVSIRTIRRAEAGAHVNGYTIRRIADALELQVEDLLLVPKSTSAMPGGQTMDSEGCGLEQGPGRGVPVQQDPGLRGSVLSYLQELAKRCAELPYYFPDHLSKNDSSGLAFDRMRQTVRVVEDRRTFHRWLAEERKRLCRDKGDSDGLIYSPIMSMPEMDEWPRSEACSEAIRWDGLASRRFHRATILGDPGSGKSWLLRYEARRLALMGIDRLTNEAVQLTDVDCPVLVRLPELTIHDGDRFEDAVLRVFERDYSKGFLSYLRQRMCSTNNTLLLDAWDEVSDISRKRELGKKILAFARCDARILLTSRSVGYDLTPPPLPDSTEMELLALDWDQAESFVRVWYGAETQRAERFVTRLRLHPQFRGLGRIPLMLMLLCQSYPNGDFPTRRSDVYRKCLWGLLREWHVQDKGRYPEAELNDNYIDELIDIVGDAALELYERGKQQFKESELSRMLKGGLDDLYRNEAGSALAETRTSATSLIKRLKEDGVLVSAASDDRELRFLHLTLQEYCAATAMARRADCIEQALKRAYQPTWGHILAMLGGLTDTPGPYIAALLRKNKDDLLCRPFTLAMRAAAERDRNEKIRVLCGNTAAEVIQTCAYPEHAVLWDIAWHAIQYLPEAVESMVARVSGECQSTVETIEILSKSGSDIASRALLKLLNVKDRGIRIWVIAALRKMPSERAIPKLLKMLGHEDRDTRLWVIGTIGTIGSERAVPTFLNMLDDKDRSTRAAAVWVLGQIGSEKAVRPLLGAIADRDRDIRWRTALALGRIGSKEAIPDLLTTLRDRAACVRWSAAMALDEIGCEQAAPTLLQLLRGKHGDIRRCAAWVIGRTHSLEAKQGLHEALRHEDRRIRETAAWGVRETASTQVILALVKGLRSENKCARGVAAWNLGEIGSIQAIPALCKALGDKDGEVRIIAANALGKIGSEQAVPALCKSLGDKDKTHRGAVAWALGEIRSGETISAVLPLLDDRDSSVRAVAADAVRKMCPDQGVSILIRAEQIREKSSDVDAPANVLRHWQPFVESLEHLAGLCKDM